jgi:hypothetical protein
MTITPKPSCDPNVYEGDLHGYVRHVMEWHGAEVLAMRKAGHVTVIERLTALSKNVDQGSWAEVDSIHREALTEAHSPSPEAYMVTRMRRLLSEVDSGAMGMGNRLAMAQAILAEVWDAGYVAGNAFGYESAQDTYDGPSEDPTPNPYEETR